MGFTQADVLEFVRENDVKFIRLAFCDLFGVQKNIAIMAGELPAAFAHGVCVDTAAVPSFVNESDADIFLFPDPQTLSVLPWRSSQGQVVRLFCDIRDSSGQPYVGDSRHLLRKAVEKATGMGYSIQVGCECEFYLFRLDEEGLPTQIPQDQAGYCDFAPLDKGEAVRREICIALQDMGIQPESSHHERGPGQNEICYKFCDALQSADILVSFFNVAEIVAAGHGLKASFLPKPLAGKDGSALHINLSLFRDGVNQFRGDGQGHSARSESFLAGILYHLPAMTLFLNPLPSSYKRFGDDIATLLTWSHQNRDQLVRIPAASGQYSRMELRSPDPSLSPYLAFALLVEAGLWGIETGQSLKRDIGVEEAAKMPGDLGEAIALARRSELVTGVVPQKALEQYCKLKEREHNAER